MSESNNQPIDNQNIADTYDMYKEIQKKINKINDVIDFIEDTNIISQLQTLIIRYQDELNVIRNHRINKITNEGPSFYYKSNPSEKILKILITFMYKGEIYDHVYDKHYQNTANDVDFSIMSIDKLKSFYNDHPYHIHTDDDGNEIITDDNVNEIQADPDINGHRWYLAEHCYNYRTIITKLVPLNPEDGLILFQKYNTFIKN